MSAPLSPAIERRLQLLMDLGERALILVMFTAFFLRVAHTLTSNPFNLFALVSEGLVVIFILIRRPAAVVSTRPMDWILAMGGTMLPLLARPVGHPVAPPAIGAMIMMAGLTISIWAKVSLQRSFGIAAANRGVILAGPYRLVRHPMYAGYILVYVGFLLNNPLAWNALIYLAAAGIHIARILAEERVLREDPDYQALMGKVRHRLAPGLF